MPRTFGSFGWGWCAHAARASSAHKTAAILLQCILDILRDVRAPVDDVRAIDDQNQLLLPGNFRHRIACLIDERFEYLLLLIRELLLIIGEDLLLLFRIVLGALHLLERLRALIVCPLREVIVGVLDLRHLVDLRLVDVSDFRGPGVATGGTTGPG